MSLQCLRIEKFCWCCNLHTGTIIAAVFGWFLTTISILFLYNELEKFIDPYWNSIPRLTGNIIGNLFAFVLCILLIMSVAKRNTNILRILVIFKGIECIILAGVLILLLLAIFFLPNKLILIIYLIFSDILLLGFAVYFWICIWSLFLQISEENYINNRNFYNSEIIDNI